MVRGARPREERALRLDPVRWPRPRPATLVRAVVVAGLLALAAGLASAGTSPGCPPGAASAEGPAGRPHPPGEQGVDRVPVRPGADGADGRAARARPPAGTVGIAVTLADPAAAGVVAPGDRVDLLAGNPEAGPSAEALLLAPAALVLAASTDGRGLGAGPAAGQPSGPRAGPADGAGWEPDPGPLFEAGALYLAVTARQARAVAGLPPDARLTVTVRP